MKLYQYIINFLSLAVVVLFYACKEANEHEQHQLLNEAQLLVEDSPQEALILLDSIIDPEETLSDDAYMQYLIVLTQAKFKNGESIQNDTLLEKAVNYFEQHHNDRLLGIAYFCAGNLNTIKDDKEKAFGYYLKALDLARSNNDLLFEGKSLYNLGYQYYYNNVRDTANIYWQQSLKIFQQLGKKQHVAQNLYMLALIDFQNQNFHESKQYALQALAISKNLSDKKIIFSTNNLLGILAQAEIADHEALKFFNNALSHAQSVLDSSKVYINITDLFLSKSDLKNAGLYKNILEQRVSQLDDVYTLFSLHLTLKEYYERSNDYKSTYSHYQTAEELNNLIEQRKITKQIYELDKQYTLDRYKKQEAYKKKQYTVVSILIIICLTSVYFYRHITLRKKITVLEDEINRITKRK